MDMANKISRLRKERGMTLEEVGKKVGVGKSTVRKWETGMIENMRRDKIAKLAQALGTTPAYLMGWEETSAPISPDTDKLAARTTSGASLQAHATDKVVFYMPDNSMILDCIPKDARLQIKTSTPQNGDIAMVSLKSEMLVRRYTKLDNGTILLEAANPKYKTVITSDDELDIVYGIVKSVSFDV